MKVARYDYPAQFGDDVSGLMTDLREMLLNGHYVLSEQVNAFEEAFADYNGVKHARGLNSGTDALYVAMLSLGIQPGDEVITQANTFYATVAAICLCGAKPVLVDADAESFLMDHSQIEAAITEKTRAIIPVHLFGKPTEMSELLSLAGQYNLWVIEDAAQAHGARIGGERVGSFGDIGCYSFHPSKNLAAAGDGGAIVTNDDGLAEEVSRRRALGQQAANEHVCIGLNTKLDALQARILLHKLPQLDQWNQSRREIADIYRNKLADLPVYFQRADGNEEHVYHLFQLGLTQRDALREHLQSRGVDATVRYPVPIHLQEAFRQFGWRQGEFKVAERLATELVCLPIRPQMPLDEVDYVVAQVRSFFGDVR